MTKSHIHFLGICGYAVSGAALLARELGYTVTGSDDHAYPPTTDILTQAGIAWVDGSSVENLTRWGRPAEVVVGNQTRRQNPEWLAALELGLPVISEIEFYARLSADRMRLAICGTHGKTTTTALVAHMLNSAGMNPGLRLGSTSLDLGVSARLGSGPFVFEGDEYTSAPWDPRPKFLHMAPHAACVTNLELDHPDIYPSLDAYRAPFIELARSMSSDGVLVLCGDDAEARGLASHASCRVVTYGEHPDADWRISATGSDARHQHVSLHGAVDVEDVAITFPGRHTAANAPAALILSTVAGAPLDVAVAACADFRGPARRFQVLGDGDGVTVVDDYAHHPTECGAALAAARQRYPARRIIGLHTPHTYSRTLTLLQDYAPVFADCDLAIIGPVEAARERGQPETVTNFDVAAVVTAPHDVRTVGTPEEALRLLVDECRPGDVVVTLSLGGFDKFAPRLLAALQARHG